MNSQNKPAQAKTSRALLARGASVSSKHATLPTHTIKNKMQASARAGWRAQMFVFERCKMGGKGCASVCAPRELVGPRGGLPCSPLVAVPCPRATAIHAACMHEARSYMYLKVTLVLNSVLTKVQNLVSRYCRSTAVDLAWSFKLQASSFKLELGAY